MKNKNWYDEQCKKLLSNKWVLLNILKREIEEYKDLSDDEVLKLISEPQTGAVDDFLETQNTEDLSIEHEKIIYDVILYAGLPNSTDLVGLIINFEVQGNKPKYPILKRGFYYLSRLISRQKGHPQGFSHTDYGKLKKVVGIWIYRTEKKRKGMLNVYRVTEEMKGTQCGYAKEDYDVMQLIVISPNDTAKENRGTVEFLSLLFGEKNNAKEAKERLEKEYGVVFSHKEREDFIEMCNWSESHYLNGKEDGEIEGRRKGRAEGRAEGKVAGRTEGKAEEKRNVIRRMNEMGISIELIAASVALSTAEVLSVLS